MHNKSIMTVYVIEAAFSDFYPIEFVISASFSAEDHSFSEIYVVDADTTGLIYKRSNT